MKRLPYIDEHVISIDANPAEVWSALLNVMCRDPRDPTTVPFGFVLDEASEPERFALKGRHPFAVYRWVFELDPETNGAPGERTRVRALTWAAFPGLHGKIYRALVIGTGGHRVAVRRTLSHLRRTAQTGETEAADYVDVFEVPILQGDVRSAEEAFRDALGDKAGTQGGFVLWIHRHVLRFRLGPYSSPEHIIGWPIMHSDHDEIVLATGGPLMRGQLELRREDGQRAVLTTRLHYRHKIAAPAVWAIIGPLHRMMAPRLMERSARVSERTGTLPCNALCPQAGVRADRAISIDAAPSIVFAWLCQLRVAPYSYDILDNLGRRSPRRRDPGLAHLEVGQRFMTMFALQSFVDDEQITLQSQGVAVTYALRSEAAGTRLHARVLFAGPRLVGRLLALGDLVMMRKQLRTLKSLAEQEARSSPSTGGPTSHSHHRRASCAILSTSERQLSCMCLHYCRLLHH